ncbi:MAG TPA: hypothetical protein VE779_04495 [Candidatus Angelobacter sp.]|jgi:hypothetical protein|nr:hypothetical protein [Candidatus Angelobacter sp.]
MTYVVHVTMTEGQEQLKPKAGTKVHVEGKYEYKNLEKAREAAEVACFAAAKLNPSRTRTMDDDDWTGHPDRSD